MPVFLHVLLDTGSVLLSLISQSVLIKVGDHGRKGYVCYARRVNDPVGGFQSGQVFSQVKTPKTHYSAE